jgi:hypothetical protein
MIRIIGLGMAALLMSGCAAPQAARDLAGQTSGFLAQTAASAPALQQSLKAQNNLVNRQLAFERTLRDAALARSGNIERQWEFVDDSPSKRKQRLLANIRRDDAKLAELAALPSAAAEPARAAKPAVAPDMGPMTVFLSDIVADKHLNLDLIIAYGKATNAALKKIDEDAAKAEKDLKATDAATP